MGLVGNAADDWELTPIDCTWDDCALDDCDDSWTDDALDLTDDLKWDDLEIKPLKWV